MGEQLAYGLTDAARYLKLPAPALPSAAELAWKRTLEFFDQRLRK